MNFGIVETQTLVSMGFNTEKMRKSLDGLLCVIHEEFGTPLCVPFLHVYDAHNVDFCALMKSEAWFKEEDFGEIQ